MKRGIMNVLKWLMVGLLLLGGGIRPALGQNGVEIGPDNNLLPPTAVSVQTLKAEGSEQGDFRSRVFSFRFDRTAPHDIDLHVFFTLDGTAKAGVDYKQVPSEIVIPAGQSSAELLVETLNDELAEGDETVLLTVIPPVCVQIFPPPRECYQVGASSVARAVIRDDEKPGSTVVVGIQATVPSTREICAPNVPCTRELVLPGEFTVTRSGSTAQALTVYLSYGGTATPGSDYEGLPKAVTFAAGQSVVPLRVLGSGDYLKEADESVEATVLQPLTAVPGYLVDPKQSSATVIIQDRPAMGLTGIVLTTPAFGSVFQPGEPIDIQAVAMDVRGAITRVEFFAGDKQIGVSDIQFIRAPDPGTPIEHQFLWSDAPTGEHVITARGLDSAGVVRISDKVLITVKSRNEGLPVVSLFAIDPETSEIAPHIRVKPAVAGLARTGDPKAALKVWVEFGGTATHGRDYEAFSQWVEFPAGSATAQITIAGTDDALVESTETVVISLHTPPTDGLPEYGVDPNRNVARLLIHDSDGGPSTPIVSVTASQPVTSEPCPVCLVIPGAFTVSRTGSTDQALTVFYNISGSAQNGIDYERITSSVQIPAGKPSAEIRVLARMDEIAEAVETVVLELHASPAAGPLDPYRIDPDQAGAKVVIHDRPDQQGRAVVTIVSPKSGERFLESEPIDLIATTVDPKGAVTHLDWFANGEKIGSSDIFFIRAPDAGMPITLNHQWLPAKTGSYKVVGVGMDASGNPVESEAVLVEVVPRDGIQEPEQAVVDIVQSDGLALETGENGSPDPGVLKVRRIGGPRNVELHVNYVVSGSAVAGVDYAALSGTVVIPVNEDTAPLIIQPIPDKAKEGDESVVVTLSTPICPLIFPPPPNCYQIGRSDSARVVIRGDGLVDNSRPTISFLTPKMGEVFEVGRSIKVAVVAASATAKIALLEILLDGRLTWAGKESELTVEWKDALPGMHSLMVRATDDQGNEVSSQAIEVFVRDPAMADTTFPERGAVRAEIQKIGRQPSGRIQLQIGGPGSQLIAIEVSDDLNKWFQLDPAMVPTDGVLSIEDNPDERVKSRFYRVKTLPMSP